LLKARDKLEPIPRHHVKSLLVAEGQAPGLPNLSKVDEEVRTIDKICKSANATVINDIRVGPTIESTIGHLPEVHILHLACHGRQMSQPLESHFALQDGPLTIASLMKLKFPHAMLAFLSACETAKGDKDQPDQAVHLAASMLFCGFRSVVATMWCVLELDAVIVVRKRPTDFLLMQDNERC
jgi:CHAT domain-containing protein